MKEPIEVKDIRAGDLIRWESASRVGTATEWIATIDRDNDGWSVAGSFFLLDRPKPAVELPTEPTLGWLNDNPALLAKWRAAEVWGTPGAAPSGHTLFSADHITAFTPATAVPTSALDELRELHDRPTATQTYCSHVRDFLAAVDASKP